MIVMEHHQQHVGTSSPDLKFLPLRKYGAHRLQANPCYDIG